MGRLAHWTCLLGLVLTFFHPIKGLALALTDGPSRENARELSPVLDNFTPIPNAPMTNRMCNLESLGHVQDDQFCNKYYVCSAVRYVPLFCPTGMVFDSGQQICRRQSLVDCSTRPKIASYEESSGGASAYDKVIRPDKMVPLVPVEASTEDNPAPVLTLAPVVTRAPISVADHAPVSIPDSRPVSTPATAATLSRSRTAMKLSRSRKTQRKDVKVANQPQERTNGSNSSTKSVEGNDNGGGPRRTLSSGSLPSGSSPELRKHRFNLARAKAAKAAKAVKADDTNEADGVDGVANSQTPVAADDVSPRRHGGDAPATTTTASDQDKITVQMGETSMRLVRGDSNEDSSSEESEETIPVSVDPISI